MSIQEDIQKIIATGDLYPLGESVPEDWQQAFATYTQLAKQGNAKAQFNLGCMFARGDIMERDMSKAFEWFQKAANNGDSRAHYNLAKMYEQGEFVLPDEVKVKEHLARAIELGDDRAKNRTVLANAKEALLCGDREKARTLFSSIAGTNKEAEMGVIACNVIFKSIYAPRIKYSYHSSGTGNKKKFWKWGDSVETEVDLTMTNSSAISWPVLVKALFRSGKGTANVSTIGGVLKAGETQSNIIDPEDFGDAHICGVTVYSDREGTLNLPFHLFYFPDVPVQPDSQETEALPNKIHHMQDEMEQENKIAKPGGCFVLTVCYGSYDAPTVLAFRQFRDNHLLRYKLGKGFVFLYYRYSPYWADLIGNQNTIKAILRAVFNQVAKLLPK